MAGDSKATLRSRATRVNYKETNSRPRIIKQTLNQSSQPIATSSTSSINRLSTSRSNNTPIGRANQPENKVTALETRLTSTEDLCKQLQEENTLLKQLISQLQSDLSGFKDQINRLSRVQAAAESGISPDQIDLNENIIIRGIDIKEDAPESELLSVFSGIRTHLGIAEESSFDPVSIKVLASIPGKENSSPRPIQVQLPSVASKKEFLQVRRSKKEIFPTDIGCSQQSRRPVLITEHLSRSNQELLYKARSLRGRDNYKFVWSCNGQILVRRRENTKVIRIVDSAHVNLLRAELGLEPLP